MNRQFFVIWTGLSGVRSWSGPYDDIDLAKASVPETATASVIMTPLAVMTPGEKREALPILEMASE